MGLREGKQMGWVSPCFEWLQIGGKFKGDIKIKGERGMSIRKVQRKKVASTS
jgi:hypothetical protein